ncbi:MAG: phosphoserine transaminase [Proteobacteria bacterium]|nr:phosphoserine transaminase [Pseudomonadota bacterium]
MARHTTITIPADMLPDDGRFGSGPSRVERQFIQELSDRGASYLGTSHRRSGVRDVVRSLQEALTDMYALPDGYEVVLGVGGATLFWDAAAYGLVSNRSAHFVCGEFSEKFASVARGAPHLDTPVTISAEYGSAPEPEDCAGVDVAAYIHNETSTGVLAPFARTGSALVVVDGTSAAGAIPIDPLEIDTYYFSPQKALGSDGGLWLAIMSPAAIDRIHELDTTRRWIPPSLSLATAIDNSRKNQTYNTPALVTLYLIERQLASMLEAGGIAEVALHTRRSSQHLYSWADNSAFANPFVENARFRSPTVVTIDLTSSVSADTVATTLRNNGIVDIEGYRKLGRNQLRVATFPNIPTSDIQSLTACIDYVVERM